MGEVHALANGIDQQMMFFDIQHSIVKNTTPKVDPTGAI
jgi:hypothetical protein